MHHGVRECRVVPVAVAVLLSCAGVSAIAPARAFEADVPAQSARSAADASGALQAALDVLVAAPGGPVGVIVTIEAAAGTGVWTAGEAALGAGAPPSPDAHMRIASLTKAFTATLALRLVDEGVLALHDSVGKWLPELPRAWHPVTLAQLLQHTSGVPDFGNEAFGRAVSQSPTRSLSPREILAFAGDTLDFEPGSRYTYSNSNPFVTGLIVEAATGRRYSAVLGERVLEPFALRATYLPQPDDPSVRAPVLRGYTSDDREDVTEAVSFGGWAWASGGLVSTPSDLGKFVRGYVPGALLAHVPAAAFIPGNSSPRGPGENSVGLGGFRYETRCGSVYGHTGSILGYTQFMAASADGRRSVTLSISTQYTEPLLPQLRAAEELAVCIALGEAPGDAAD